ncbi:MAG: cytochrome C [Chloroflexi bacterium]|nr:cytochrome C [Chloroflexota bacterium]
MKQFKFIFGSINNVKTIIIWAGLLLGAAVLLTGCSVPEPTPCPQVECPSCPEATCPECPELACPEPEVSIEVRPESETTTEPVEVVEVSWRGTVDALLAEVSVSAESQVCIDCHLSGTPKMVEQWVKSKHAGSNVDCMMCHRAQDEDWDATEHYNDTTIATNPTAGDCAMCHKTEYDEFSLSKHSGLANIFLAASFDRNVLEPTIATKHGCQECHNVGHFWPDQSVGECDACHPKHTFDVAVARNPYTCGECHIGPDHPHIEIWLESKHGNVFMTNPENWEQLGYEEQDGEPPPFDAPTCTTCHMDATVNQPATHDVGARMGWETQSPWTIRTTEAWGGGLSWEEKRANLTDTCFQCHAQPFVDRYLLEGDLAALQYNEIFREGKRWLNEMNDAGIILTAGFEGLAPFGVAGYDEVPEEVSYHIWHHEGRRFRHGALMMGADYTQWHGIWDLQHDMIEMIRYGAEHGLPEALAWMASDDPAKFWLYPFYDVPGSAWGIDTLAYRMGQSEGDWTTKIWMNRNGQAGLDTYWDAAYANVQTAYEAGLLSEAQWELYQGLYENREVENGNVFPLPELFQVHLDGKAADGAAAAEYGAGLVLPAKDGWNYNE